MSHLARANTKTQPDATEGDINMSPARDAYMQRPLGEMTRRLLERDAAAFLHQSLSSPCMNALAGARGDLLIDTDGRELLDFHGNSAHQVGHAHPRVIEAVKQQLDQLPFCPRRYTCEPAVRLAEQLGELTGGMLTKVLLALGGSLAMGIAMKLVRIATGRHKFVSMWGAFHGAGLDTISIGGEAVFRKGVGPLLPGCSHVHACAPSACAFRCRGSCTLACAASVEEALRHEGDVAAVIAEPIRCTTVELPHPEYWRSVREACDRHGALLIFDEIPICLGRTGSMFAYQQEGVTPDILVLGKGLGGGVFPQAALLVRRDLDVAAHTALGHYTHEKSPVGAAAGLATLSVIRDEGLCERAMRLGDAWRSRLRDMLAGIRILREVRGRGLLVGVELRAESPERTARAAEATLYASLASGLSFKVSDGRVLTLTPPLTVSEHHLESASLILQRALRHAADVA